MAIWIYFSDEIFPYFVWKKSLIQIKRLLRIFSRKNPHSPKFFAIAKNSRGKIKDFPARAFAYAKVV